MFDRVILQQDVNSHTMFCCHFSGGASFFRCRGAPWRSGGARAASFRLLRTFNLRAQAANKSFGGDTGVEGDIGLSAYLYPGGLGNSLTGGLEGGQWAYGNPTVTSRRSPPARCGRYPAGTREP